MSGNPLNQDQNSEEIDLRDLILPLWSARKQIILTAIVFAVLGGIIGFLTPPTYTASSTFLPQTTQSGGAGASLGGLAALAGINLNAPMAGGDIPSSMYATVVASDPFRSRILDAKIWANGDSVTYRSYLENQPKSGISILQEYTLGLPFKIVELLSKEIENEQPKIKSKEFQIHSYKEYGLLNNLSGKINITIDKKDGVVSISTSEADPYVAAQLTNVTEKVLQDWISNHRMKNSKAQYDFIEKQFKAKQKEFFAIQGELAEYMDRNQNVLSASYLIRLNRLQAEFDLVNSVYSELAKQKEQAAIQLSKDTPTFSVLNPVKIPMQKTGPNTKLYVVGAFFAGIIISGVWYVVQKPAKNFFKSIQSHDITIKDS